MRAFLWLTVIVLTISCGADAEQRLPRPAPASAAPPGPPGPRAPVATDALAALPRGPAPRIAYTEGYDYVADDGTRTSLPPGYGITGVAPYGDGFVVADSRIFEGTVGLAVVDAAGRRVEESSSSGTPLPGREGEDPVWVGVRVSENLDPQPPPSVRRGETVQVLDPADHPDGFVAVGSIGERIYLSGFRHAFSTDLASPPVAVPLLESVQLASDPAGLLVGTQRSRNRQSVVDPAAQQLLWSPARRVRLRTFSPDGRRLLASTGAEGEGRLLVLDARTGSVRDVVRLPDGLSIGDLVWEDARHVLTVASDASDYATSTVVRIGLDGVVERTVPMVRLGPNVQGYVVPRRP